MKMNENKKVPASAPGLGQIQTKNNRVCRVTGSCSWNVKKKVAQTRKMKKVTSYDDKHQLKHDRAQKFNSYTGLEELTLNWKIEVFRANPSNQLNRRVQL